MAITLDVDCVRMVLPGSTSLASSGGELRLRLGVLPLRLILAQDTVTFIASHVSLLADALDAADSVPPLPDGAIATPRGSFPCGAALCRPC